jgi:hypothetical protein
MTTNEQEAARWNAAGAKRTAEDIAQSRAKAAMMLWNDTDPCYRAETNSFITAFYQRNPDAFLGVMPLGAMPANRETDGGMSLAPKGFGAAVIRSRAEVVKPQPANTPERSTGDSARVIPRYTAEHYDYEKQVWIGADGRYLCCAHPREMNCQCYGRLHYGELAVTL